jgi:magnesium-transporting ATPase (P-type)
MGQTRSYKTLTPHLPAGSLLSLPVLTSVLGCVFIQAVFQVFGFFFVRRFSFYTPPVINIDDPNEGTESYENTTIFYVSLFQNLLVCVAFSISKPFRQPLYTNLAFTVCLIVLMIFSTYVVLSDDKWVLNLYSLMTDVTMTFRLYIILVIVINSILTYFFEKIVIWYVSLWWKARKDRIKHRRQMAEL